MAGIATALRPFALELVDLLEDEDRQDDDVVFELEDRSRVVKKDVRVEDVVFSHLPNQGDGAGSAESVLLLPTMSPSIGPARSESRAVPSNRPRASYAASL